MIWIFNKCCIFDREREIINIMKTGEKVKISPNLSGLDKWIEGSVIEVENNKFNGIVIASKTKDGRIFFGQERYFQPIKK